MLHINNYWWLNNLTNSRNLIHNFKTEKNSNEISRSRELYFDDSLLHCYLLMYIIELTLLIFSLDLDYYVSGCQTSSPPKLKFSVFIKFYLMMWIQPRLPFFFFRRKISFSTHMHMNSKLFRQYILVFFQKTRSP